MRIPLIILPLIIPLATALIGVVFRRRGPAQKLVSGCGALAGLVASFALLCVVASDGIQVMQAGDWPAPFGISLVSDLLSAILVFMTAFLGFIVVIYSFGTITTDKSRFGYYPFIHFLLFGVTGAFLTGDIFNLYVWFEVLLIASFVLLTLGGTSKQIDGGLKYVVLNLISSLFFLTATGVLYAALGTLNMADIAQQLAQGRHQGVMFVVSLMYIIAFGTKAAIFPFFFWLPASYHTAPIAVVTIFSALMSKVGVYGLLRLFTLIFHAESAAVHDLMLFLAETTMVIGVLGAVAQTDVRRLLSFHIVSQIGYMVMGIGINSVLSIAGAIYFIIHIMCAKSVLFLVAGVMRRVTGHYNLDHMGNLASTHPVLAVAFFVPAMSLAGIPPLSGFWGKFMLVFSGLEAQDYFVVAVALFVSILTLFSMVKIWNKAFWKPIPEHNEHVMASIAPMTREEKICTGIPIFVLGLCTVLLGIFCQPIMDLLLQASEQLLHPEEYIHAVLGGARS